jgi:hypothetical protein
VSPPFGGGALGLVCRLPGRDRPRLLRRQGRALELCGVRFALELGDEVGHLPRPVVEQRARPRHHWRRELEPLRHCERVRLAHEAVPRGTEDPP